MMTILDQIGRPPLAHFQPKTMSELFAFRVAQRLGEPSAGEHYRDLVAIHGEDAIRSTLERSLTGPAGSAGARFHQLLGTTSRRMASTPAIRLVAVKVERRSVAAAVFNGDHLDYTQVRQLSSTADRAEASCIGFINWILANFNVESAAIEMVPTGKEIRRALLIRSVIELVRSNGIPVWEVSKQDLFDSFSHPRLRSRKDLRPIVRSFWPVLEQGNGKNQILDAAAIGAWVQVERRFIN